MSKFHTNSIPILKPTVQRNDFRGNIFLRTSSRVTEIEAGTVYHAIVGMLDGEKTLGRILVKLEEQDFAQKDVFDALEQFDELKLLQRRAFY